VESGELIMGYRVKGKQVDGFYASRVNVLGARAIEVCT
jgi:hypothetical protein